MRLIDADALEQNKFISWTMPEFFNEKSLEQQAYQLGWNNAIEAIMENMPTADVPQWIPCSERLPNCNGCYLVWRPHFFGGEIGMPSICYFDGQNTWHDSYGVDFERVLSSNDVTAWMPLPEPWKGEADGRIH